MGRRYGGRGRRVGLTVTLAVAGLVAVDTTPAGAAPAGAVAAGAAPAGAASVAGQATPAQKVALTRTNRTCDGVMVDGDRPTPLGQVVVTRPASGKLVVSVSVTGGSPDTTYAIRVIQLLPGDADCHGIAGYLTTDSLGGGRASVQEAVLPGASRAWVDLNATDDFTDFLDGEPVSF